MVTQLVKGLVTFVGIVCITTCGLLFYHLTPSLTQDEDTTQEIRTTHDGRLDKLYDFFPEVHSEFFPQFLFRFKTSSVHLNSRESDISHGTIDDLASKLINYLTKSVKKGSVLC